MNLTSIETPPQEQILIVDDDATNLHVLREALKGLGHKLIVGTSGEAALSLARKHRPELILLDVMMPGMDGFEVCRTLKADPATRDLAVIFLTALDQTEDKVRGFDAGAVDYVAKPFQPEEIIARVTTHLTMQRLQRNLARANRELEDANQRMRKDLEAAARVQSAHLPHTIPPSGPVRFEWRYHPCDELAGDLLNVFVLDPRHIGFYVLDVTGHGVPAALLSVAVSRSLAPRADLDTVVTKRDPDSGEARTVEPAEVLGRLNAMYPSDEGAGLIFTIVYGIVDFEKGELRYASAGHPGPVVLHPDGTVETLDSTGVPISVVDDARFEQRRLPLGVGMRIYLFSDGLYEERDQEREMFGLERLVDALRRSPEQPLARVIDDTIEQIARWRGVGQLSDDVAVLALEIGEGFSPPG
jgi:sigma-B regulation protein RsbU (phosphoserine phosphatase)